jgi:uncharacterized protein (DUF433 family)
MTVVQQNLIEIVDGKARIIGTRFKVDNVVAMYVWNNTPIDWIVENYPLTRAQIHAALAYYYDGHQEEIEQSLREVEQLAREVGISAEEGIARMRARQQQQKPDSNE